MFRILALARCLVTIQLILALALPVVAADYEDGGTHNLGGTLAPFSVSDSSTGQDTTVNLDDTANVSSGGLAESILLDSESFTVDPGAAIVNGSGAQITGYVVVGGNGVLNLNAGATATHIDAGSNPMSIEIQTEPGLSSFVNIDDAVLARGIGVFEGGDFFSPPTGSVCVNISGGTIGATNAQKSGYIFGLETTFNDSEAGPSKDSGGVVSFGSSRFGTTGPTVLDISGGTFAGMVINRDGPTTITGGQIGNHPTGLSFFSDERVTASDAIFTGAMELKGRATLTNVMVNTGAVAVGSVWAYGQDSDVDIVSGTYSGPVKVLDGGRVLIRDGLFEGDSDNRSAFVRVDGSLEIQDGTFDGGIHISRGGAARISGGSYGEMLFPGDFFGSPTASVYARTDLISLGGGIAVDPTTLPRAVADIFGGSFDGSLIAGPTGEIHVYGTGLQINSDVLTGTLSDGTAINAPVATFSDGEIFLHNVDPFSIINPGFNLLTILGGSQLTLPMGVLPSNDCVLPGDAPGSTTIEMTATNDSLQITPEEVGVLDLSDTAMVIRRVSPVNGPESQTVPIELVALQLRSAEPIDLTPMGGFGTDFLYLALDPVGPSRGTIMFNPQMQTFEMSLDLNFLLLEGGPGGNVLFSGSDTLTTTTQVPFHFGSLSDALTPRDNAFDAVLGAFGSGLAGFDFEGSFLSLNTSTAFATAIPEPSTFALTALGVLGIGWRRRKRA